MPVGGFASARSADGTAVFVSGPVIAVRIAEIGTNGEHDSIDAPPRARQASYPRNFVEPKLAPEKHVYGIRAKLDNLYHPILSRKPDERLSSRKLAYWIQGESALATLVPEVIFVDWLAS